MFKVIQKLDWTQMIFFNLKSIFLLTRDERRVAGWCSPHIMGCGSDGPVSQSVRLGQARLYPGRTAQPGLLLLGGNKYLASHTHVLSYLSGYINLIILS